MSSVLNRLTVPSFDLTFLHLANDDSQLPVVLIPGGGGSTKSGVLNQIQIGKYSGSSRGFSLLKPMMTDAEGKSNFCSAIATGFLLSNKQPSICAVMDDICAVFLVSCKEEDYSFEKKVEFKADHHSSFAAVNACLICQGKHIITGGEDGVCRLWVISQGGEGENKGIWEASCVREMKGHTAPIMALALHPSRPWIASASKDGSCKIWDSLNGQGEHLQLVYTLLEFHVFE